MIFCAKVLHHSVIATAFAGLPTDDLPADRTSGLLVWNICAYESWAMVSAVCIRAVYNHAGEAIISDFFHNSPLTLTDTT